MEHLDIQRIQEQLAAAQSCADIRAYRDRLHEVFQRHLLLIDSQEWNEALNHMHDAIIQKVVELSVEALKEEGFGAPPLSFSFVLYGSGGRCEQTLWSDQDNGLIYEDCADEELAFSARCYFRHLSEQISSGLEQVGYPPCTGGVICTNEKWCKPLTDYARMVEQWLEEPNWENVRYLLIVADLRTVYGDPRLGEAVLSKLYDYVMAYPIMLEHMLQNTLHHKISLGIFGQLIKERYGEDAGGVDVKYGVYIPMVNAIRLLAIAANVRASSTFERIDQLLNEQLLEEELAADWTEALALALRLRSLTPYQVEDGHYNTRGKLTAEQLTKERIKELKLCLRVGADMQRYVKKMMDKE